MLTCRLINTCKRMTTHKRDCNVPHDKTCCRMNNIVQPWKLSSEQQEAKFLHSSEKTKRPNDSSQSRTWLKNVLLLKTVQSTGLFSVITKSFLVPAVGISLHPCGHRQHHRAKEPHALSPSLLQNSPVPPPWPDSNGAVTSCCYLLFSCKYRLFMGDLDSSFCRYFHRWTRHSLCKSKTKPNKTPKPHMVKNIQ